MLDVKIPFLEQALDLVQAQAQIQTVIPSLTQVTTAILVRHKPGRRALVKYHIETTSGPISLLGKIRAKGTDVASYQVQQALWENGWAADSGDGIATPEPLGMVPAWHMILQRKVSGIPATQLLAADDGIPVAQRIAALAHKLHRTPVPTAKTHTLADELAILRDRLPQVAHQHPHWATRIEDVLEACDRLATQFFPPPPPTGIHRDFYADQILIDAGNPGEERLWLVDLDLYCLGSPAVDIGNFIAHITEQSLRELGDAAALRDREVALQETYLSQNSAPRWGATATTAREIDLYTVLTLVRHIHISTRIPSRRRYTEALLSLSETRLAKMLDNRE
ncbi:phosphotransferase [Leptolyngbya sp. CCNP1308]|uniref:phosphotransferase family protein n=1 Tax=Leptolyngbya sp. CCNP1308 TaxID=3110255 RepID=UPI002B1FDFD9|nr:phosphotransferase [Leptolyngbya sp. CCNP1308]MEA5447243.1 phosphotransferase [Leptolyngbya sp. CCNP1308]